MSWQEGWFLESVKKKFVETNSDHFSCGWPTTGSYFVVCYKRDYEKTQWKNFFQRSQGFRISNCDVNLKFKCFLFFWSVQKKPDNKDYFCDCSVQDEETLD